MPPRNRKNAQYRLLAGIVILIGLLNIIYVVPYFESEEDTGSNLQESLSEVESSIKVGEQLNQESAKVIIDHNFNYNSLAWPRLKSENLFKSLFNDHHFWWISERVQSLWPEFEQNASKIKKNCNETSKKKIVMLPGVLVFTNFASREIIRRGGSLGELTQWADLMAGSLALCHYVIIKTDFKAANAYLQNSAGKGNTSGCSNKEIDLIFTDITGLKNLSPQVVRLYKNKFRILDVYGTEASSNDPEYAESHLLINRRWAGLDLNLKQFCTMFPHTPDNSFLGFVVSSSNFVDHPKQNYSLILGKEASYLKGKMELLKTFHEFFPVAATIHQKTSNLLPEGSLVLGVVSPMEYLTLLSAAKVCIGLGDPIESPSPLLSLAAGCIFMNPMKNQTLRGKPTNRKITSQHVYLERYIKPPHVFTYNMSDYEQLRTVLEEIQQINKVDPIIPVSFTAHGFLDRLENSIISRNFCYASDLHLKHLPPLRTFLAKDSGDCKDLCYRQGLICEPDYFVQINSLNSMRNLGLKCKNILTVRDLYSPALDEKTQECHLQPMDDPLFSCVGDSAPGLRRVCPCTADAHGEVVTPRKPQKSNLRAMAMP